MEPRNDDADAKAGLRHFLDLSQVSAEDLRQILHRAAAIKARRVKGAPAAESPGANFSAWCSTSLDAHRVSFDIAMRELAARRSC